MVRIEDKVEHEVGCYRAPLVRVWHETATIGFLAGYRRRWSCPKCTFYKLGCKFEKVIECADEVRVGWEMDTRATRLQATRKELGCMTFRLHDTPEFLVVANPKIKSLSGVVYPTLMGLSKVVGEASDKGVKRVSINQWWMPKPRSEACTIIPAPDGYTWQQVQDVVKDAGYGNLRVEDRNVERAVRKISEYLYSEEVDMLGWLQQ